jgi:hypothetical protein
LSRIDGGSDASISSRTSAAARRLGHRLPGQAVGGQIGQPDRQHLLGGDLGLAAQLGRLALDQLGVDLRRPHQLAVALRVVLGPAVDRLLDLDLVDRAALAGQPSAPCAGRR